MSKELLFSITKKDLTITYFRGSGAGGQHRNKTDTACRILHKDSGAFVECQEHKSQDMNRKTAFKRLIEHPKFKIWHTRKCNEILEGKSIEEKVEEQMNLKNLKVEYKENDKWK